MYTCVYVVSGWSTAFRETGKWWRGVKGQYLGGSESASICGSTDRIYRQNVDRLTGYTGKMWIDWQDIPAKCGSTDRIYRQNADRLTGYTGKRLLQNGINTKIQHRYVKMERKQHHTVQYTTTQYNTQQSTIHNTVNTLQHSTIHNTVQYTTQCNTQHSTIHNTVNTLQHSTIHNTVQYNSEWDKYKNRPSSVTDKQTN
jgi:hypothetical protein